MSLNGAFGIAAGGLGTAAFRVKTHTQNVANTSTPYYLRKVPVVHENDGITLQGAPNNGPQGVYYGMGNINGQGVAISGISFDHTPGKRYYEPGHPQADKDGYITLSNVNVVNEMADSIVASRLYEANLAVVGIVKQMATRALEIGRGQ
jgi:flagellar basal-body rod protein FlgC